MAYRIRSVTIRTDNSPAGMQNINEVWQDIISGKIPLLFDSERHFLQDVRPVSEYSCYESDEHGSYDFTILGADACFFENLEEGVRSGVYRKYEADGETAGACTKKAWEKVWNDTANGTIERSYTCDYESTVPAEYSNDNKAHCFLYIAVENNR